MKAGRDRAGRTQSSQWHSTKQGCIVFFDCSGSQARTRFRGLVRLQLAYGSTRVRAECWTHFKTYCWAQACHAPLIKLAGESRNNLRLGSWGGLVASRPATRGCLEKRHSAVCVADHLQELKTTAGAILLADYMEGARRSSRSASSARRRNLRWPELTTNETAQVDIDPSAAPEREGANRARRLAIRIGCLWVAG